MHTKRSYTMSRRISPVVVILAMLLAGCGGEDGTEEESEQAAEDPADSEDVEEPEEESEEDEEPEISGNITMSRANWDTEYVVAEIHYLLLTELGYDVDHPENNELGAELFYQALDQGDVDFWPNGWFPLHDPFFDETSNAVKVGEQMLAGGFQGYLVDMASAEQYGITSVEQIAEDDELQALFDLEGDDRADLIGCNAGWGCFEAIERHLEEQDLGGAIEHVSAEYSVLMSDVIARHQRGEPIFYYTWTPNWTVGALAPGEDVVWIEAPTHPDGEEPVPGVVGCVNDPCDIGWTANDIVVVANQSFLDENPPAARLLELIEIPVADVSAQNLLMEEGETSQADILRHAETWIEDNRDLVDGWIVDARAATA